MFSLNRLSWTLPCLISLFIPGFSAATNLNTQVSIDASQSGAMQLAYNGSFVTTRTDEQDPGSDGYKIKRGDAKGAKLIEHTMSLLVSDLKDAKNAEEKQSVWDKANAEQKLVYTIYEFRKAMEKGGFQAYFRAEAGTNMTELKKALIAVHANQYLLVLNKAVKAFADDPHVLDDTFGRNGVLDQMDEFERFSFFEEVDAEYRSLEDDEILVDRVSKYLNEHQQQFFAKAD